MLEEEAFKVTGIGSKSNPDEVEELAFTPWLLLNSSKLLEGDRVAGFLDILRLIFDKIFISADIWKKHI